MYLNPLQFVLTMEVALSQGVSRSQAVSDALISAMVKSPLGMFLGLILARGQEEAQPAGLPTITTQPTDQTVKAGLTATFSVTATGPAPLTYQWFDGQNNAIQNATQSSYTTPAVKAANDGNQFMVTVSSSGGSVTSNLATLHVPGG